MSLGDEAASNDGYLDADVEGASPDSRPQPSPVREISDRLPPSAESLDDDARCMELLRSDDAHALQALMERHWSGLVRYAIRMSLSEDDACDVAQEVFVRVWQHRTRWCAGGSVQGYLYRIARTLVLERFRRTGVRERARDQVRSRAERVPTPLETTAGHELRSAIEDAIDALPERRREAFILVRIQGLSLAAAAEALGVARQTAANHVHLAVQDLQRALGPYLT